MMNASRRRTTFNNLPSEMVNHIGRMSNTATREIYTMLLIDQRHERETALDASR